MNTCWRPDMYEGYYSIAEISGKFRVINLRNTGHEVDRNFIKSGNCFRIKEEAEDKLIKINKILKEGH